MKEIQLTQGYVAMVDDEDYQRVSMFMWHTKIIRRSDKTIGHLYAETSVNVGGKTKHIFMHRLLLNPGKICT